MNPDPKHCLVEHLHLKKEGSALRLKGWVYNFRSSGKIGFLLLRDGSGIVQCVLRPPGTPQTCFDTFKQLNQESCIQIEGTLRLWKQSFEVEVKDIKIISPSEHYPIGKKDHGQSFLLDHRHLWLRSKKPWAILKIRHTVSKTIESFFSENGFLKLDAPILTPTSCEGTSDLFSINFFEKKSMYLSQSGQLYMEAGAGAFGKVYCFNPTFRAEKSSTRKHLLEFWMVEPEMAFYDLNQCMSLAEDLIMDILKQTLQTNQSELSLLGRDLRTLEKVNKPFPKLPYTEASKILLKEKDSDFQPGQELTGKDETLLSQKFDSPVFIHHYPANTKAFYMKTNLEDSRFSNSFDLLAPEGYGEIIGGSEREDNLSTLEKKIEHHRIDKKSLKWYLDLRQYGTFPHSGFGMGLERVVAWLCGLAHVREAIPFPRLYGREFFETKHTQ